MARNLEPAAERTLPEPASPVERLQEAVQCDPRWAAGVIAFWLNRGE